MSHDLPPESTAWDYIRQRRDAGTRQRVVDALRRRVRGAADRDPTPRVGYDVSQSAKTTEIGGARGYDGGK